MPLATMKISEQLDSAETRTKKRKRELVSVDERPDQNEDDLDNRSPTKRTKQASSEQDVSKVLSNDKDSPKDNDTFRLHSQYDNKKKGHGHELSQYCKTEKKNITEVIGSSASSIDKTSAIANVSCDPNDQKTSPKKIKKKKKNTNQDENIVDCDIPENNSVTDLPISLLSTSDEIINFVGSKNNSPLSELSSPKKNKRQKKIDKINNDDLNESKLISNIKSTDSKDTISNLRFENNNVIEEACESTESTQRTSPRRGKRKKRKIDDEVNESESIQSSNSVNITDTVPASHSVSDDICESSISVEKMSPKKSKKKKSKFDKNSNVSKQILFAETSENTLPTSDSQTKPLKSCLKKKKRKTKKKKNQTGRQSNENSLEDEKKLSNRSVSFDNNVKIELIENCLSKPVIEKTPSTPANTRKKAKALSYLKCWKEDRQNWKFEKLTQLWLIKNMLQEDMVPGEEFDYLLQYLVDLKGAARSLVIDLCNKVISCMEQKPPEEENKELDTAYNRARAVQQLIPEMQDKQ